MPASPKPMARSLSTCSTTPCAPQVSNVLMAIDIERDNIYDDLASGGRDDRPGLTACLKSLRDGDVLVVWKLDRLGRSLAHLVNTVKELSDRKIGLRVLTGKGAQIDTTTASGRMVFGIFATLAEFTYRKLKNQTIPLSTPYAT